MKWLALNLGNNTMDIIHQLAGVVTNKTKTGY